MKEAKHEATRASQIGLELKAEVHKVQDSIGFEPTLNDPKGQGLLGHVSLLVRDSQRSERLAEQDRGKPQRFLQRVQTVYTLLSILSVSAGIIGVSITAIVWLVRHW